MWQMNEQLKREEEDLCGKRGLEPNTERQTFEMEVPFKFREQYDDVVRPLRQGDVQLQRRNIPNNPSGKFYFPVAPGLFTGYPSLCFKERLRLQSSSQILKHLCDFSLPNVDLGLQSFQCSKIRSAQHWGRRAAHLSENKGVKRECKKFGENSRQMLLFQRFVTSIAILVTNLETLV